MAREALEEACNMLRQGYKRCSSIGTNLWRQRQRCGRGKRDVGGLTDAVLS